ncbi:MAG: ABC transporter ATP-binding protein, partial [Motiliproteus sp.]|nr:ABC transporter ATP-binding protein [Motiliproteus sp.]
RIVMMTNGPAATVGEILDIELARPRDRIALADDSQYNHYRHEVLRFLYEKQSKVEDIDQHRPKKVEAVEEEAPQKATA